LPFIAVATVKQATMSEFIRTVIWHILQSYGWVAASVFLSVAVKFTVRLNSLSSGKMSIAELIYQIATYGSHLILQAIGMLFAGIIRGVVAADHTLHLFVWTPVLIVLYFVSEGLEYNFNEPENPSFGSFRIALLGLYIPILLGMLSIGIAVTVIKEAIQ
jgi:hypothetical protein